MKRSFLLLLATCLLGLAGCGDSNSESATPSSSFMPNVVDSTVADATAKLDDAKIAWQLDDDDAEDAPDGYTVCSSVPKAGDEVGGKTATLLVQKGSTCSTSEGSDETDSSAASTSTASSESSSGDKIKVPDVVGMNHQEAQDLMQEKGLYMLMEEDSTGAGRMLILDRNWVVVRQKPKAGARVSEEATITLYSKKYTD